MNTRDEITVQALIRLGLSASAIVSILALFLLSSVAVLRLPSSATTMVVLTMLLSMLIVILGTFAIHALLQRKVQAWILGLVDICRDYAGGDHTVRASVSGDDTSALLAQSLNTLLDSQVLDESEQVEDVVNQQSYGVMALQVQVERLIHEVGVVARGDLPLDAGVSSEALGMLADSFAYMIEAMAQGTKQMHTLAAHVTVSTQQVVEQSEQLEQESGEQLTQMERVTQNVEELAVFLQEVARKTHLVADTAEEAIHHTQQGKTAVYQAMEGLEHIQTSLHETTKTLAELKNAISDLGEVQMHLGDIVEHAQILAGNNTIQNAFTGEQNQSDAGVTEDIRSLANRSATVNGHLKVLSAQMQEIVLRTSIQVETSSQHASSGIHLVAEASRALTAFMLDIGRQIQLLRQFTQEADMEAPQGIEVAHFIAHLADLMNQTHMQQRDQLATIATLAKLAEELREFTSKIRIPDVPLAEEGRQITSSNVHFADQYFPQEEASHFLRSFHDTVEGRTPSS